MQFSNIFVLVDCLLSIHSILDINLPFPGRKHNGELTKDLNHSQVELGAVRDNPSNQTGSVMNMSVNEVPNYSSVQMKRTWRCDICLEEKIDDYNKAVEHEKGCTKKKIQVDEPGPNDVILGRGGAANHNEGNTHFHKMVDPSDGSA